jgi:hypothetical protein
MHLMGRLETQLGPVMSSWARASLLALIALLLGGLSGPAAAGPPKIEFDMVRNGGLPAACVPDAIGHVKIESKEGAEEMHVKVEGLPPNTGFDLFVIQKPGGPFGMSWYQGDIQTDKHGKGHLKVVGRFNIETFIVAPGMVPAPQTHPGVDAMTNPTTAPVHTYHLGLWFDSPADGASAGCPGGPTPFNGDHTAGIQLLNTSNFPDLAGPLSQLQ